MKKRSLALSTHTLLCYSLIGLASGTMAAPPIEDASGSSLLDWQHEESRPNNPVLRKLLRETVTKALRHSPELRAAQANASAADHEIDEVKGRRWPQVQLGMDTALHQDSRRNDRREAGDTLGTATITTKIWDWGQNRAELRTAKASLGSAEQTGLAEQERVALDTCTEMINLIRSSRSLAAAEEYVQQMSNRVDMLRKIAQADRGRVSELVQARAKLISAQASRTQLENRQALTRIRLERLLGEPAPALPTQLPRLMGFLAVISTAHSALERHPLLLRLKQQARMEEGRGEAVKAQGLPALNLVASRNDGLDDHNNNWYIGVGMQWQAFSGGSNRAAQAAAQARQSAALEEYEQAAQDLRQEIDRLAQSRDNAARQAREYQQLSVETDQVRKMFYEQWYSLGKRTLLDVLVAENDYFNNQLLAIDNEYDSMIADLNILSSAGILVSYLSLQ